MSNAIPSAFAGVSKARVAGMGLRRSDLLAPQYFVDAKDFHQSSYLVAQPSGRAAFHSFLCPVDAPYGEPRYRRTYVLHMRLPIRGQSDQKPGCDSGDTSTPKCPYWSSRTIRHIRSLE